MICVHILFSVSTVMSLGSTVEIKKRVKTAVAREVTPDQHTALQLRVERLFSGASSPHKRMGIVVPA